MVVNILALQEFYESLIYFGFVSINTTSNQLIRLKHFLTYIGPLGCYYHFSEQWITFYESNDNLPMDKNLPVGGTYQRFLPEKTCTH